MPPAGILFLKMFSFRNEPLLLLPPRGCLTVHTVCFNLTLNSTLTSDDQNQEYLWMDVINYICYLLLPMVIFFCLLGQVVNIIILTSQIRLSLDTYLLGMSIASLLHVCATIVMCSPYYVGHSDSLVYAQYYSMISREWFTHVCLWLLISLSLERSVSFSIHKTYIPGTSSQTWIITGIVTCVGFVSVLPRLWEYSISRNDWVLQQNTSSPVPIIYRTPPADGAGFSIVYFWYLTSMFVVLPIFLMLAACIPLYHSMEKVTSSKNDDVKCSTNTTLVLNRRIQEDIALTRLVIALICLNMILTLPLIFLHILAGTAPRFIQMNSPQTISVQNIFTILYYINFILPQQLYFCYNKQYRLTLLSICCCCC